MSTACPHHFFPTPAASARALNPYCLIVDGNSHRPDLIDSRLPQNCGPLIAECLIPNVRSTAQIIAAARHDFSRRSPRIFTEEADWFAARIIVLHARCFHLDVSLHRMLAMANNRAQAFSHRYRLPFTPAQIRMSLYAQRPNNLLMMDCALPAISRESDFIANSSQITQLMTLPINDTADTDPYTAQTA